MSQLHIQYRKASLADADTICHLSNSAYRGEASRKGWTTEAHLLDGQRADVEMVKKLLLAKETWFLLAEVQNEVVGSILLERHSPEICYFGMFAIDPLKQGKGTGRGLLDEAERFAREDLSCRIMEMTVITVRTDLIPWYERMGYKKTGETRPFPYHDQRHGIPLRKDLELGVFHKRLV
ncbi:MAG: GNAT family N-acetyltransferase [Pseudobdellovibrionaceae bacterium]